jgi:hypothetical protein
MRDTIDMAREAGFNVKLFKPPVITAQHSNGSWVSVGDELKAFETLVRADALANTDPSSFMSYQEGLEAGRLAEREACAKVCESLPMQQEIDVRDECAAAIRERGDKHD